MKSTHTFMKPCRFPEINEYTAPALTMCVLCLCAFVLVHFHFKDAPKKEAKRLNKIISSRQQAYESFANTPLCFGKTSLYTAILISCMFLNAFGKGPMSCFETLGIELAERLYGIDHAIAGFIVASCGLLGCIILFLVKLSFSKHEDSKIIILGILLFALGITLNINLDENNVEQNSTWRFACSMFLAYSVGYPVCHTATVGLFSKSTSIFINTMFSKRFFSFFFIHLFSCGTPSTGCAARIL